MWWTRPPAILGQVFPAAWWSMPAIQPVIHLTFDDGPHPDTTPFLLDQLATAGAKATFFCLGRSAESYPELMKQIEAEGHRMGHHTYSHLNGWNTEWKTYLDDVHQAAARIPSMLFRPPYGKMTWPQWKAVKEHYQVVMWSRMPEDYREDLSCETLLERLTDLPVPGEIVVLHENDRSAQQLPQFLPQYLTEMTGRGFTFETLPHVD